MESPFALGVRLACVLVAVHLSSPIQGASADSASMTQPLRLKSGTFDPLTEAAPAQDASTFAAAGGALVELGPLDALHFIAQFSGGVGANDVEAVERAGGEVLAYLPEGALIVRIASSGMGALRGEPSLRWAGRLEPWDRIEPGLLGSKPQSIVVTLFPGEAISGFRDRLSIVSRLGQLKPDQLGTPSRVLGTYFKLTEEGGFEDAELIWLARQEAVWYIERFHEARPVNDDTIWVGQSHDVIAREDYAISATIWNHGILGTGQIAGVIDTGLEADSCYFKYDVGGAAPSQFLAPPAVGTLDPSAKVRALYVLPGYDTHASRTHGTGTMGIVLGDNFATLSTPTTHGHDFADGMAPNAQLVAQVPLAISNNLPDAFAQAYDSGVRVHSNSWVSGWNFYTEACRQADAYLWDHEDFFAVFSGGNTGGSPNNALVGAPSVAKNVVCVGGTSPGDASDADNLSDRSRGPAFDGRIKPDIVAPAEGVATAGGDGLAGTDDCVPVGFGGTSAAGPAVAGFAVLVRQYFSDGFYPSGARRVGDEAVPSAALIKACLLNGATPLLGIDPATAVPVDPVPSFNQGWGRVLLDPVLWFAGDPRRTRVWDRYNATGLVTGEADEYTVLASPGEPLKVTLVWTDPPAAPSAAQALVHDLDLEVVAPSSLVILGNQFSGGESVPGGVADTVNNVEGVLISNPEAGMYRIRVVGRSVPPTGGVGNFTDRQGYALVATFGDCSSSVSAPANLSVEDRGLAGIRVAWDPVPGATGYTVYRGDGECAAAAGTFAALGETSSTTHFDDKAMGGLTYSYEVRATDGCGESMPSTCAGTVSTAECSIAPTFDGLRTAEADGATCAVRLAWDPATSACPTGPGISYNVYRSTLADFVPTLVELLAAGVHETQFVDSSASFDTTYFYVVRAEDSTTAGGGLANGGNEDRNLRQANATPFGLPGASGSWFDDGGDTAARFSLSADWSVSSRQNHTSSGTLSYRSGRPGALYASGSCSAIVSPELALDSGGSPILSYWANYNLEDDWDGVVVELSDDGGASWQDLPPDVGYPGDLALTGYGFGLRVNACYYPQTQGAFSGPPGNAALTGWAAFSTDLSAWAGQSIRVRFQLSTDNVLEGSDGFYVDDIQVTDVLLPGACTPCTSPGPMGNSLRAVKLLPTDAHFTWADVIDASGYRLIGSLDRALGSADFTDDALDGASGVVHGGALVVPDLYFYEVRAKDSCGGIGP